MSAEDDLPPGYDEDDGPEEWDPDELLARALWRSRHGGGTHLQGDWRGLWHGLRGDGVKLRAEAERAVRAEHVHWLVLAAVDAVRRGRPDEARALLAEAARAVG